MSDHAPSLFTVVHRVVLKNGIVINGCRYWSKTLEPFVGQKVSIAIEEDGRCSVALKNTAHGHLTMVALEQSEAW